MKIIPRFVIVLFATMTFLPKGNACAQIPFSQTDENNYYLGLQCFREGDNSTAEQYFRSVMNDSLNQRSAESFYYGTKCLFNLHDYTSAIGVADTFLLQFPTDDHRFEVFYILGVYITRRQTIPWPRRSSLRR